MTEYSLGNKIEKIDLKDLVTLQKKF